MSINIIENDSKYFIMIDLLHNLLRLSLCDVLYRRIFWDLQTKWMIWWSRWRGDKKMMLIFCPWYTFLFFFNYWTNYTNKISVLIYFSEESNKKHPFPCPTTYRTALTHYLDITHPPRTNVLYELAQYASDTKDQENMRKMASSSPEGKVSGRFIGVKIKVKHRLKSSSCHKTTTGPTMRTHACSVCLRCPFSTVFYL